MIWPGPRADPGGFVEVDGASTVVAHGNPVLGKLRRGWETVRAYGWKAMEGPCDNTNSGTKESTMHTGSDTATF